MFNLGHFYFAQNRTFLLCLDRKKHIQKMNEVKILEKQS